VLVLCSALVAAGGLTVPAMGHPAQYHSGALAGPSKANLVPDLSARAMLQEGGGQLFPTDEGAVARAAANPGPCTTAARDSMPDGAPHDHQQIAQHAGFRCAVTQSEFLPLKDELTKAFGREDVIFGEIDVKADIAAASVTFPRAGVVFFDLTDPAKPKLLSIYRGGECDAQPIDINCGAFVDLSADGKVAYLSVQNLSSLPDPSLSAGRPGTAGVEVISLVDPKNPQLVQIYTVTAGLTGTHTARSHVIPAGPSGPGQPRAPGEYIFSNQNSVGVNIAKVERLPNGLPQVRFINLIEAPDLHDTFTQNDPTTGRTYLYLADGFGEDGDGTEGTAFVVYDVTDPASPERLGQWDLTPECERDWYSHTIDVTTRNGRRYVTLPAELFVSGNQSAADSDAGCGKKRPSECGTPPAPCERPPQGNGNVPGPMWIVDATDFSKLAQATDSEAEIKSKSQDALVTTWENPAGRAGGNLTFTPHNQQIVGDAIYLSSYHGGMYKLDASRAFDGIKESADIERPRELGFVVPSGEPTRKNITLATRPARPFITEFPLGHPEIWDMVHYRGCTVAADMTGGFYSFGYDGDRCTTASGGPLPSEPVQSLGPLPEPRPQQRARDRLVISGKPRQVTRSGLLRVRLYCASPKPCAGLLKLRTTGKPKRGVPGNLRLGTRRFSLPARKGQFLSVKLSTAHQRGVAKQRQTAVRAFARVAFGGGKARRVRTLFSLTASKGLQRRLG